MVATGQPLAWATRTDRLAALVRSAVEEDDPRRLVELAAAELGCPLGLVGAAGEPLAHAPDDAGGRRALMVAGAVARRAEAGVPSGWRVVTIATGHSRGALLAAGPVRGGTVDGALLDAVVALVGEQLLRAWLRRDRVETFLRRLVSEPWPSLPRARWEAATLGLALGDTYWPAVAGCSGGVPGAAALTGICRMAGSRADGGLAVTALDRLVLLHPGAAPAAEVIEWTEQIVAFAQETMPSIDIRAVVADHPVGLPALRDEVARLARLCGHGDATPRVTHARRHALHGLLREQVAPAQARRFVDELLGALIAWDDDHGSDLVRVLEAALDHPRHDVAAQRCFMHRNTFRHRLQKARDLVGDDLTDPQTRLAVHVALKLRRAAM